MVRWKNKLWRDAAEELAQVIVQLLHLQQEPVVSVFGVDFRERRVRDAAIQLLLLGEGEKHVRLDSEDQRGLLNHAKGFMDHLLGQCAVGHTVPRDIVGVQLMSQCDVAVGVKSLVELLALVLQVGLCTPESGRLGERFLFCFWF